MHYDFAGRMERQVKKVEESPKFGSHSTIGNSTNPDTAAAHMASNESDSNKNKQSSLSSPGLPRAGNSESRRESVQQLLILENINEKDVGLHKSELRRESVQHPLSIENINEKGLRLNSSELMTTSFIEDPTTNIQTLTSEPQTTQGIASVSTYVVTAPSKSENLSRTLRETESESDTCSSSSVETCSNTEQRDTTYETQKTTSVPLHDENEAWTRYGLPDLHDVPDDESILSYSKSNFYDNDALEMETRQLLATLEERFEALINEITEKHEKEILRRLKMDETYQRQKFGGVYKYFDPNKFSAPW